MLLRLVLRNVVSFRDEVEFNTFPSEVDYGQKHHICPCDFAESLRLAAFYGANGAGKSNLVEMLGLLRSCVIHGEFWVSHPLHFRFDAASKELTSGIELEFYTCGSIYIYRIELQGHQLIGEELSISSGAGEQSLFCRKRNEISLNTEAIDPKELDLYAKVLSDVLKPNSLLLSYLGDKSSVRTEKIVAAYQWFSEMFYVVLANDMPLCSPDSMTTDTLYRELVNELLPRFRTGIQELQVRVQEVSEEQMRQNETLSKEVEKLRTMPDSKVALPISRERIELLYEYGKLLQKKLVPIHRDAEGNDIETDLRLESDGTIKIIDYMPMLYDVIYKGKVYVVDEIEKSLHPILIKELVRLLSELHEVKGQLIFTTHEVGLLDQALLRPDEVWFAEKDRHQGTQLYPLSEYRLPEGVDLRDGYLQGRYGAIPFLSNARILDCLNDGAEQKLPQE